MSDTLAIPRSVPAGDPAASETSLNRRLAMILMMAAFASKVLGFLREILMAHLLGATLVADSFRGAMTATLLPLAILQHDSVTTILIPLCRDWRSFGDAPRRVAALTFNLTLAALVLMIGVELLGGRWIDAMVSGFDRDGQRMTLDFARIMALGMPGAVMSNCLAAGELTLGRSRLTSLRSTVLNLSLLAGIGLFAVTGRYGALAWSFAIAFDGLAIWGGITLWREGELSLDGIRPTILISTAAEFCRRLRPLLIVPLAEQGNVWLERTLASRFITGTVASLDYARTLTESAVLLVSQPLGLVVMSGVPAADPHARIEAIARPILCVALPVSVFLGLFAPDITRLIFQRGAFDETAVLLTSQALRGIACGLWASTLGWILLRMLNTTGRNVCVAIILTSAFASNAAVNLLTYKLESNMEPLMLGLGETVRWYVLLVGTAIALKCGRRIAQLLAIAIVPAATMGGCGWLIEESAAGMLQRIVEGGIACTACILIGGIFLTPSAYSAGIRSVRLRWRGQR
ncbi:MAG: lipid II flippase MurJ [Beijerinckiaceae bacterium]|nr:lipid II flippase MurJ [Beijerinckiaceae bacterium]